MEFFDKIEEFEAKISSVIQDRLNVFNKITSDFDDYLKNEKDLMGILNLNRHMWEIIKELKENRFFKTRLVEIKGRYDKFFTNSAATLTNFNKENNQAFVSTSKSLSKGKRKFNKKRKKLNHENLYYNSQKRNYFNVYKNNFAIYFDQSNFKSINKYYSKISEKKNINKITIDLIKKRIHQKIFSILTDKKNSVEKVNYNSSPKIINNNVSILSQNENKKKNIFAKIVNDNEKKSLSPEEKNYQILKKTFLRKKDKKNKENIIKKTNYPLTISNENKNEDNIHKPTILKECDNFISRTLMEKMHEFKYTFTDNMTNKINIKEALKKLKYLDKKCNYNDYMDEIYSTDNIIENYNKNKFNIKIIRPDKLAEIKKKKSDFYQNLIENKRALLETPSNYYVKLERNKLGVKIDLTTNKNLISTKISKTETTTQCDFYKDKDLKRTTVTYLQEHLMKTNDFVTEENKKIENNSVRSFLNYVKD